MTAHHGPSICRRGWLIVLLVGASRIGVIGLSYGGKWSMFAACLYDKFACAVWSDPGIMFNEKNPNVNYWEPWYLGYDPKAQRNPGVPSKLLRRRSECSLAEASAPSKAPRD